MQARNPQGPNRLDPGFDIAIGVFTFSAGIFFYVKDGMEGGAAPVFLLIGLYNVVKGIKQMRANFAEAEVVMNPDTRPLTAADIKSISFQPQAEWDGDAKSHPIMETWPIMDVTTEELGSDPKQEIALIPLNKEKTAYQACLLSTLQQRLKQETIATIHQETSEVVFMNFYGGPTKLQDVVIITGEMFNERYNPDYRPDGHLKMS